MVKRWHSDFIVSAHEFGHCIGIPDEYLDYSGYNNLIIRNSQPTWDTLCNAAHANVALRNWHSQFNESIMSIGTTVYPAHAATMWAAVDEMTINGPNQATHGTWAVVSP